MREPRETGDILRAAAGWHVALDTADDADWDAFTLWLEADDAHRQAYDRIALADLDVTEHHDALRSFVAPPQAVSPEPAAEQAHSGARRRWAVGGVAAALAVGALSLAHFLPMSGADPAVMIATAARQTRTVPLEEGGRIEMAGLTSLSLRDGDHPVVLLSQGAALFDVPHDPSRPLVVQAGGYEIRDIGTRFDVRVRNGSLSVGVAEGLVELAGPGVRRRTLKAGERLDLSPDTAGAVLRRISGDAVGAWTDGRLVFEGEPLDSVVADLNRYATVPVSIDPGLSRGRTLSAVIAIGDGSHIAESVAGVLDLDLVPIHDGRGLLLRDRRAGTGGGGAPR